MERITIFEDVKKGRIPLVIKENFPIISKLLSSMVNSDPALRPKAKEVVVLLTEYLNQCEINSLGMKPSSGITHKKSRKRFLSEDITKIKSYELLMKESSGRNIYWRSMYNKHI